MREVLAAGARGYILISDTARELVTAITSLTQHRTFITSTISESPLNALRETSQGNADDFTRARLLTARELQIVQMLASGQSNREIARMSSISMKTVETHRSAIMRKVGPTFDRRAGALRGTPAPDRPLDHLISLETMSPDALRSTPDGSVKRY